MNSIRKCNYRMAHFKILVATDQREEIPKDFLLPVSREAANDPNNSVYIKDRMLFTAMIGWMQTHVGGGQLLDEEWSAYLLAIVTTVE